MVLKLKTEQEIKSTWVEGDEVVVSILCMTFNHELYIQEAINGFLMQETIYPFEVIIHDDASTDATASIAKSFADLYPNIVKLVVQKENQYSKGEKVGLIAFGYASGKYIALCEGDDYWIDPHKLQIQINEMMRNSECDISFHPAMRIDASGMNPSKETCRHKNATLVLPAEKIIRNAGSYMPTASLMFKRKTFEDLPYWFYQVPVGDYFLQCLASINAGALYINRAMSVYRSNVPGSWTVNVTHNYKFHVDVILQSIVCCHLFDSWSRFRFTRAFHARIGRYYLSLCYRSAIEFNLGNISKYAFKSIYYYFISGIVLIGHAKANLQGDSIWKR